MEHEHARGVRSMDSRSNDAHRRDSSLLPTVRSVPLGIFLSRALSPG